MHRTQNPLQLVSNKGPKLAGEVTACSVVQDLQGQAPRVTQYGESNHRVECGGCSGWTVQHMAPIPAIQNLHHKQFGSKMTWSSSQIRFSRRGRERGRRGPWAQAGLWTSPQPLTWPVGLDQFDIPQINVSSFWAEGIFSSNVSFLHKLLQICSPSPMHPWNSFPAFYLGTYLEHLAPPPQTQLVVSIVAVIFKSASIFLLVRQQQQQHLTEATTLGTTHCFLLLFCLGFFVFFTQIWVFPALSLSDSSRNR